MTERPAESKAFSTFIDLQEDDPDLIAERLCNRFRLSVSVLNSRDYDHTTDAGKESQSYASPIWQARFDNIPRPLNWLESVEMWRGWQRIDPDVHFALVHCSCEVDMAKGEAVVFAETSVSGSGNVVLGGLSEVLWKRRADGSWLSDSEYSRTNASLFLGVSLSLQSTGVLSLERDIAETSPYTQIYVLIL